MVFKKTKSIRIRLFQKQILITLLFSAFETIINIGWNVNGTVRKYHVKYLRFNKNT